MGVSVDVQMGSMFTGVNALNAAAVLLLLAAACWGGAYDCLHVIMKCGLGEESFIVPVIMIRDPAVIIPVWVHRIAQQIHCLGWRWRLWPRFRHAHVLLQQA